MPLIRVIATTTLRPERSGVAPPTSPVLPPCGTSGTRPAAAAVTMAATCAVVRGQTTIAAAPWTRPRQSTSSGASTAGSSLQSGPAAARSASREASMVEPIADAAPAGHVPGHVIVPRRGIAPLDPPGARCHELRDGDGRVLPAR